MYVCMYVCMYVSSELKCYYFIIEFCWTTSSASVFTRSYLWNFRNSVFKTLKEINHLTKKTKIERQKAGKQKDTLLPSLWKARQEPLQGGGLLNILKINYFRPINDTLNLYRKGFCVKDLWKFQKFCLNFNLTDITH